MGDATKELEGFLAPTATSADASPEEVEKRMAASQELSDEDLDVVVGGINYNYCLPTAHAWSPSCAAASTRSALWASAER